MSVHSSHATTPRPWRSDLCDPRGVPGGRLRNALPPRPTTSREMSIDRERRRSRFSDGPAPAGSGASPAPPGKSTWTQLVARRPAARAPQPADAADVALPTPGLSFRGLIEAAFCRGVAAGRSRVGAEELDREILRETTDTGQQYSQVLELETIERRAHVQLGVSWVKAGYWRDDAAFAAFVQYVKGAAYGYLDHKFKVELAPICGG